MLARRLDFPTIEEKLKHVSRCTNIKYAYLDFWNKGKNTWGNKWGLLEGIVCNPEPSDDIMTLPIPPKIETKNIVKVVKGPNNELILTNTQVVITTETVLPNSERYPKIVDALLQNFKDNISPESSSYGEFLNVLLNIQPENK